MDSGIIEPRGAGRNAAKPLPGRLCRNAAFGPAGVDGTGTLSATLSGMREDGLISFRKNRFTLHAEIGENP